MKNTIKVFLAVLLLVLLVTSLCYCEENAPILPSTVAFVTNGGEAISPRQVRTLETAPITSRKGYVFAGWYLDKVMTVPAAFPLTVTGDMTLYAKWVKSVYTVSFDSNGGSYVSDKETDVLSVPPSPTRFGYDFDGWYVDSTLITPAAFPLRVEQDITLYAKWLQTSGRMTLKGSSIKFMDEDYSSSVRYNITPNGFDYAALTAKGYKFKITVTYDVRYIKDYDVLWDIGYLGSPKYEISLMDSDGYGTHERDLGTSTKADTRTIRMKMSAVEFLSEQVFLKFSTDNVQNIIYFENISVVFEGYRG